MPINAAVQRLLGLARVEARRGNLHSPLADCQGRRVVPLTIPFSTWPTAKRKREVEKERDVKQKESEKKLTAVHKLWQ